MEHLKIFLAAVCGYLLGSVMFAVLITKLHYGLDVREQGSGNAGATNVARVFGMGGGIMTFVFDALKTLTAMFIGRALAGDIGFAAALMGCILGHCFPVFFGFKGGKGVSVGAAIALAIDWRVFLLLVVVFFGMFILTRRVSACSVAAAISLPVFELVLGYDSPLYLVLGIFSALLVCVMHHENIKRLIKGEEAKFKPGKKMDIPENNG